MHKRILFGLVAWLLGAATATAGCLLAVSLLGQGIGGNSAQQLTEDAVNRALASEVAESTAPATPAAPASARPASRSARRSPMATPDPTAASPAATQATSGTPGAQTTQATQSPPDTQVGSGTVFTSQAGNVVASCQASGAYLISWSPLQGYETDSVVRGPAASARVTFESANSAVTMVVTCSAGMPSETTSVSADH